jgi:hypothetical protein
MSSKIGIFTGVLAVLMLNGTARSQETDTTYALIAYGGIGYSRNLSHFDIQPQGLVRNVFGGTLRIMWKPEHLLRLGIETGLTQVYYFKSGDLQTSFGPTNFSSSLNAVPILLSLSMPLTDRLDIYASPGSFLLYSTTEAFGTKVTSTVLSVGYAVALSYMSPLEGDWQIGGELKWYHMDRFSDNNIMLQVMVSYRFLEW